MRFSTICSFLAIAGWASAGPIRARQNSTDIDPGLAFIVVLEEIAVSFFEEFLEAFTDDDFEAAGFSSAIRDDIITTIASNEDDHFTVLQGLLGAPPPNCTVDFTPAFPDVATALEVARQLDTIAVGGYIGLIANDPESDNLELFAEILANEAQHKSMMDFSVAAQPVAHAFEMGLNPAEILAMLLPFNPSCTPDLSITPNTPLGLSCQILNGDDATATPLPIDQCSMQGQSGATFIFVTTDDNAISADPLNRLSVPSICAGPALALIDS
ncbi:hypothetical protein Clacol_003121 [Clathrus columnatus]|uniref:Ferritin-like domain-containing protein n=1 Tax=Clathrus columnatus TaxID=1419009 RepID=A0AAV5A8L7_9AGAM|nr:hypothetical protein Clacol_003121 [Clathrus columnatus]